MCATSRVPAVRNVRFDFFTLVCECFYVFMCVVVCVHVCCLCAFMRACVFVYSCVYVCDPSPRHELCLAFFDFLLLIYIFF